MQLARLFSLPVENDDAHTMLGPNLLYSLFVAVQQQPFVFSCLFFTLFLSFSTAISFNRVNFTFPCHKIRTFSPSLVYLRDSSQKLGEINNKIEGNLLCE